MGSPSAVTHYKVSLIFYIHEKDREDDTMLRKCVMTLFYCMHRILKKNMQRLKNHKNTTAFK